MAQTELKLTIQRTKTDFARDQGFAFVTRNGVSRLVAMVAK
jgi:hypothetical protein